VDLKMQQETMTLKEFIDRFKTEEDCRKYFFKMRWPNGFACPKCEHKEYSFIKFRNLYQCKDCGHQASLTAGTIMHKSHTGLREWFLAIFLVVNDKRGISASQLSKIIGVSYYTAWLMLHKLRDAMAQRDRKYLLGGKVEMDDAFFGAPTEGGRRGRGTEKTPAIIELELDEQGRPQYMKAEVVEAVNGEIISEIAKRTIEPDAKVYTDGLSPYGKLSTEGYEHHAENFDPKKNPDHLHWLHTIISNLKAFIGGTYHGLDKKHLQRYFDEFCYRFNRRKFEEQLFNRLLAACVEGTFMTYKQLIGTDCAQVST
jgi:transposase-like protein